MRFRKPELIPTLFIIAATVLLCSLGIWQLERLSWKNELIAKIAEASSHTPLQTLPEDLTGMEYRRVALRGLFARDIVFRMAGGKQGVGAGFFMYSPFILPDGRAILVNRGFLPNDQKMNARDFRILQGVLRPVRGKSFFLPDNQPDKNVWLSEDLNAMSAEAKRPLLPLIIEATGELRPGTYPIANRGNMHMRNDHLGYALTWFTLALIGMVSFGFYYRIPEQKTA